MDGDALVMVVLSTVAGFAVKMLVDPVFPDGTVEGLGLCTFVETRRGIASRAIPATAHMVV